MLNTLEEQAKALWLSGFVTFEDAEFAAPEELAKASLTDRNAWHQAEARARLEAADRAFREGSNEGVWSESNRKLLLWYTEGVDRLGLVTSQDRELHETRVLEDPIYVARFMVPRDASGFRR